MPKGAFIVAQDQSNPRDILFQVNVGPDTEMPEDQLVLRDAVDRALVVLRKIFPEGDKRFEEYFRPLLSLAQAGLVGDSAQPAMATRALSVWKEEIVASEGGPIKNVYMQKLGIRAGVLGIPALGLGLLIDFACDDYAKLAHFFLLWTGCMVGVWLSFGARKVTLRFEDLHVLEEDRLEPLVRAIFAGLATLVVGLIFATKVVVVQLGSVLSWQFTQNPEVALLLGAFCGLSEQVLSTKLAGQASKWIADKL